MKAAEDNDEGGDEAYAGIAFPDLYKICRSDFLCHTDVALRAQLTEFIDHKLIHIKKGHDGLDYLKIPLDKSILQEFLQSIDES